MSQRTWQRPRVSVPVLSKETTCTPASASSVSPPLISTPRCAAAATALQSQHRKYLLYCCSYLVSIFVWRSSSRVSPPFTSTACRAAAAPTALIEQKIPERISIACHLSAVLQTWGAEPRPARPAVEAAVGR